MLNGFPFFPLNVPALKPDLLRENSCVIYSIFSIFEEMEERKNHEKRKPQQSVEMWPREGQDMRHNPPKYILRADARGYCLERPTMKRANGTGWEFEPSNTSKGYHGR